MPQRKVTAPTFDSDRGDPFARDPNDNGIREPGPPLSHDELIRLGWIKPRKHCRLTATKPRRRPTDHEVTAQEAYIEKVEAQAA